MAQSKEKQAVKKFTKEQLVKSNKYIRYVDFLNGNLQNGKTYTIAEVDELIKKYYGKGKGEEKC